MTGGGSGLRGMAIRGAGVTLLAQVGAYAVQLVGVTILARLLMPADFGLVTVVTTFSIFLASLGQIGFPEAVLQRDDLNRSLASNAFWINAGIASGLTVAFASTGPLLARIYGDPRIAHVAEIVSLSIFFTGATVVHQALLDRALRFSASATITIASRLLSVVVSVLLARAGWGYWALVSAVIGQPLAALIGTWSLCRWIPSFPRRAKGTGSMFFFAAHVSATGNVSYWARNLDNVLVGWRFGVGPLGFYKKAYDLFALPANQLFSVFPVAVSTLSRLTRNPAQYRRYFLSGLSTLALVGMGAAGALTLVGRDIVRLILGPNWGAAGLIFEFFAPGVGILLLYRATGLIHLSIGTPARLLRWTIIEFAVSGVMFYLALPWGPSGVAVAWTTSFGILIVPAFWYAGRPIQLDAASVVRTVWRYAAASLLAGTVSDLIVRHSPFIVQQANWTGAFIRLVYTCSIFLVLYVGSVVLMFGSYTPIANFVGVLREMLSKKPSTQTPGDEPLVAHQNAALLVSPSEEGAV